MVQLPEKLLEKLAGARKVAMLTGAGISAESGIKTFRDPDGLWSRLNPEELASMEGFLANPDVVWAWYRQRVQIINGTGPNPGHYAIAEMQNMFPKFSLATQNVDRLHQRAGSKNVQELHGNIVENHCARCRKPYTGEIDTNNASLPRCTYCGGMIRPSVVWFGENLPVEALENAEQAAVDCDVYFSVGTSAEVYPAAGLPIIAHRAGAFVVEVNPNVTSLTSIADAVLRSPAGVALPALVEALKKRMAPGRN